MYNTYVNNLAVIYEDRIRINEQVYKFSRFNFQVVHKIIPLKNRPLISLWKREYYNLIVTRKNSAQKVLEKKLAI